MILDKITIILRSKAKEYMKSLSAGCLNQIYKMNYVLREDYMSSGMMFFRQNYVFTKGEGTIYLGFCLNTYKECAQGLRKVKIEWNPQKIDIPTPLMWFLQNNGYVFESVKSIDIAFDFYNSRLSDFTINTTKSVMYVGTHSNLTRYISPKEKHGRVKIYDKTRERSVRGLEYDFNVVRVEITCKDPQFFELDFIDDTGWNYLEDIAKRLSEISRTKRKNDQIPSDLNEAMVYLLESVSALEREHAFHKMSSRTAAKYRAYFKGVVSAPLEVNLVELHKTISNQIRQCINSLLARSYKLI